MLNEHHFPYSISPENESFPPQNFQIFLRWKNSSMMLLARSRLLWFYSMLWTVNCFCLLPSLFLNRFIIYLTWLIFDVILLCHKLWTKRRFWDSCIRTKLMLIYLFMRQLPNQKTKTTNGSEPEVKYSLPLDIGNGWKTTSVKQKVSPS